MSLDLKAIRERYDDYCQKPVAEDGGFVHAAMLCADDVHALTVEVEATRRALLEVVQALGYDLTADEVAEQVAYGWTGVPVCVEEELFQLRDALFGARDDVERLRAAQQPETAAAAIDAVRQMCHSYTPEPPPLFRGTGLSEHGVGFNHGTKTLAEAVLSTLDGALGLSKDGDE